VTEWGCMQALIDFEGWRQWKELPTTGGGGGKMGARPASGIKSRTKKK
jgi:osomolarity two-component system response regulator SSK1